MSNSDIQLILSKLKEISEEFNEKFRYLEDRIETMNAKMDAMFQLNNVNIKELDYTFDLIGEVLVKRKRKTV